MARDDQHFWPWIFGGFLLTVGSFLLVMLATGGHVGSVLQLTAGLIVVGGTVSGTIIQLISLPSGSKFVSLSKDQKKSLLFGAVSRGFPLSGILGTTLGVIQVAENLEHPDAIGPGVAVAFVAILYSSIGYLLFNAIQVRSRIAILTSGARLPDDDQLDTSSHGMMMSLMLLFIVFMILYILKDARP